MDVTPPQHQDPASGDDELAKVLAGVTDDATQQNSTTAAGLQFEETPAPGAAAATPPTAEPVTPAPASTTPQPAPAEEPPAVAPAPNPPASAGGPLDDIKRSALEELRPLVDKLNLPPEEKFDTLLLIIRSTDDQGLVEAAHDAAKNIADEGKRAQALLDVIKEIDYFSSAHQPQ